VDSPILQQPNITGPVHRWSAISAIQNFQREKEKKRGNFLHLRRALALESNPPLSQEI
jgi:hypothetical protein